jgi:inorganic pyrophosphatase
VGDGITRFRRYNPTGSVLMRRWHIVAIATLPCGLAAQWPPSTLSVLPASGVTQLSRSLDAAKEHARHLWRDTPSTNADGTVNAYVEIERGDRRKWEFDMRANARAIDRVMPEEVGGYPVNYGFVPQTVSYDGDPFDALVLGPPIPGGELVRGVIVGLMYMEDDKGIDSKVVLSRLNPDGRPLHELTAGDRQVIGEYFNRYKRHEPGRSSRVPGWGSVEEGRAHVDTAHTFFLQCRQPDGRSCRIAR